MEQLISHINYNNGTHVKIDIGLSKEASQSQNWLENESDLLVIGFEPNPNSVHILTHNKHIWHPIVINPKYVNNQFFIIPIALGNVSKPSFLDFYIMQEGGTSSLYEPTINKNGLGDMNSIIKVPVFSLRDFFDLFPWDKFEYIDYIKIDAQGADFDIILGAGDYLKNRVVYITAESETVAYINCEHNSETNMTNYLQTQGFKKIVHPNTTDPTYINTKFIHLMDKIYISQT